MILRGTMLCAFGSPAIAVQPALPWTFTVSSGAVTVPFDALPPASSTRATAVLLLVPGYNGSGRELVIDAGWIRFAEERGLLLLAPSFRTTPEELKRRKGYYYPELGSGRTLEAALEKVRENTGVNVDKFLIFGFSAGAHFAHRYALWHPNRVRAFVAYSAAWWSEPEGSLSAVPALIMCGEGDSRHEATREFMEKALALELPWIWRAYRGTGHEMTPAVRRMSEVFLAHHASGEMTPMFAGDIQTYKFVPEKDKEAIPENMRVMLPSREVAEIWSKEE